MRPLIGITCNLSERKVADINTRTYQDLGKTYTDAINNAGGVPVIIPNDLKEEDIPVIAQKMDGFLFSGGVDVDPRYYGKDNDGTVKHITPERDETELMLLKYLLTGSDKPILGICRGIQVINVALGGTLYMDLPTAGKDAHSFIERIRESFTHEIEIVENTRLSQILQGENRVNSFHHQAVDKLGEGLIVSAYSVNDHVIEAFESDSNRWLVAVQWHPEELTFNEGHRRLFEELVRQASLR